jgi:hypothetical protein
MSFKCEKEFTPLIDMQEKKQSAKDETDSILDSQDTSTHPSVCSQAGEQIHKVLAEALVTLNPNSSGGFYSPL